MRRVERVALPPATARALARASAKLKQELDAGRRPAIGSSYKSKGVQTVLRDRMFEKCCCFCEDSTESSNYGQVEHYRPKARPEFTSLAYSWENLLWACGRCNGPKGDNWNEASPLVDPCTDDPADHVQWNEAAIVARTRRGAYTIELLDLNGVNNTQRYELRRDWLVAVRALVDGAASHPSAEKRLELQAVLRGWLGPGGRYRGMLAANGHTLATIP